MSIHAKSILILLSIFVGSCGRAAPQTKPEPVKTGEDCERAIRQGDLESLEAALRADPKLVEYRRETSRWNLLHVAAIHDQLEIARMLVKMGVPLEDRDGKGYTPLHEAAVSGNAALGIALLESGADPNAQVYITGPGFTDDSNKRKPFVVDLVAFSCCAELMEELLKRDVKFKYYHDISNKEFPGYEEVFFPDTALHYAGRNDAKFDSPIEEQEAARRTVRLLVEKMGDVNVRGFLKRTPLQAAATWNGPVVLETLLTCPGVDVNAVDCERNTALHLALCEPSIDGELFKFRKSSEECLVLATLLLKHGARTDIKGEGGDTPLDLAKRRQDKELITLLETYEAKQAGD